MFDKSCDYDPPPWNVYLLKCWNMLCHCQLKTIIVNYLLIKMFLLIKRLQFFLHLWNKKVNKFLPVSNGNSKQSKKCFKIAFLRLTNGNWVELPSLLNCNLSEMHKKKLIRQNQKTGALLQNQLQMPIRTSIHPFQV